MTEPENWQPPENREPDQILSEASRDHQRGDHELALQKFLWFHEHALEYDEHLSAVRLSFALSYWHDLAVDYPPAMSALLETRDRTRNEFLNDYFNFALFHELASFSRLLNEPQLTVDAFKTVASQSREAAEKIYHVAERSLVVVQEYEICEPFLKTEERLEQKLEIYRISKEDERENADSKYPIPETSYPHFIENIARLVGLLVVNGRQSDAIRIAEQAQTALPDEPVCDDLEGPLAGEVPLPREYRNRG